MADGSRDSYIVATERLSELLAGAGIPRRHHHGHETGMDALARQSGVSAQTIEGIMRVRYRHTELRVADNLVTALGRTEAFYSGELPIDVNPRASLHRLQQIAADPEEDGELRARAARLLANRQPRRR